MVLHFIVEVRSVNDQLHNSSYEKCVHNLHAKIRDKSHDMGAEAKQNFLEVGGVH